MIKLLMYILQLALGENTKIVESKKETKPEPQPEPELPKEEPKPEPKVYITLNDWITSSNRYPARANSPELTETVKENAVQTIKLINALLNELEWSESVSISSGFRTSGANAGTGGAKKSAHMNGEGLDIVDPGNKLNDLILSKHELLKKHGLWMEDKSATPTWCHLDTKQRSARAVNVFKP